jgi:epoxyqueuosine reductase
LEFEIKNKRKSEGVCQSCQKPCLTACPVSALTANGYNVENCRKYTLSEKGNECRYGCLVRKSCPFGSSFRLPEQSAFHMRNFLKS